MHKLQVLCLVSLRGQQAIFSLAQLYRSCTEAVPRTAIYHRRRGLFKIDTKSHLAYARHMPKEIAMSPERHVKVFKNGRNQAVRIPREFELSGEDAIMRKEGNRLIIEPAPPKSLLAVLATLAPLHEDFPPIEDLNPDPFDL